MELNEPKRGVVLERTFTPADLQTISECEHFDVTLLMSVLHHWEEWHMVLDACLDMSSSVIVETPSGMDHGACNNHLLSAIEETVRWWEWLGESPSHTSEHPRTMCCAGGQSPPCIRKPFINPTHGLYATPKPITEGWIPGCNLWTYHVMGGVYPSRESIVEELRTYPLPVERHGDVRPWNFILGDGLHLIDGNDNNATFDDEEGREETIRIMRGAP